MGRRAGPLRRFTPEEDKILTDMYLAYRPTIEIAGVLNRDEGTTKQRILKLGLRRAGRVVRALRWAPEHLRAKLLEIGPSEFIEACYRWREEQSAQLDQSLDEAVGKQAAEVATKCAQIDADYQLSRNEKLFAKRLIGMTLEAIGRQHGLTRERVRQLTSPDYIARIKQARTVVNNSKSGHVSAAEMPMVTVRFTKADYEVLVALGREKNLSRSVVVRQALRLYQLVDTRLKAGERMMFSGDGQRMTEFIGL